MIIPISQHDVLLIGDGYSIAVLQSERVCPCCGRLDSKFYNREGRTRCARCDSDYQQEQSQKEETCLARKL